ncbi:uncharacterized protein [Anabrus simplex]|uniref:uncharacterized protein isoform X2 n=1 Tax=Anabrus simplex TaxID=316456 RepID=UPI0035A3A41C
MGSLQVLSTEEWLTAVRKRLGTADCEVLDVTVNKLGGDVSGFLGEHLQVKVSVLVTKSVRKDLAFFVKKIPDDIPQHTEFIVSTNAFAKETRLYSILFEHLPVTMPPWGPQCFLVRPDLLVMEDLMEQGFKIVGRLNYLDYPHCEVLLRTLARFHAVSIVLDESQPDKTLIEIYSHILFENMFIKDTLSKFKYWFSGATETLKCAIHLLPKHTGKDYNIEDILRKFTKHMHQMYELVKPSTKYRNVLCHGDLWANNALFRYEGTNPVDVRIVDFQLARYTPAALDVMSFLHLTTSREFRSSYSLKLRSVYHQSLGQELSRHGYDVNKLLPWDEFQESCELYRIYGLIIAPTYHHTDLMPQEALQGFLNDPNQYEKLVTENRYDKVAVCIASNEQYRDRILSELDELVEDIQLKL